ncbi:carbohydrate kinase [Labrenzia sp. PHM005]|uniref:carbohydrate kinase family protein n=1 Tax=Labrenzia sp. PHM005 TaxID=2590016 RepID=UPI00113FD1C0|nr:carbohydrate kinase [Labrenzia sp. PHM005]QDG76745.1 carbohydrate kinase [Labrenzia sp. PHM005]
MFLVCGEALFDLFGSDTGKDSLNFDARIGGSPLNVAMGLARMGEDTAFFGGISKDALGEKLAQKLKDEGISDRYVLRTDHLTTLSLVQQSPDGQPAYTFYGVNAADRMVFEKDLPEFETSPAFIHIGSYTALTDPVASALKSLILREHARSIISFDPNIRPTVVADMELWRKNTQAIVPHSDVIKVSDEDLDLIAPGEPVDAIAKDWLAEGAKLVVVTRGKDGASAFTAQSEANVPGVPVNVIDTVGAGDTFQAALLSGLNTLGVSGRQNLSDLSSSHLTRLMTFCTRAAAITCSRRGADLPTMADLEKDGSALK